MSKHQFAPLSAGMLMKEPVLAATLNRVTRAAEALKPKISQILRELDKSGNRFEYKASPSVPPAAIASATESLKTALSDPNNIRVGPGGEISIACGASVNGQNPFRFFEINGSMARIQNVGLSPEEVKILLADAKAVDEIENLDRHSSSERHIKLTMEQCARAVAEALEGIEVIKQ